MKQSRLAQRKLGIKPTKKEGKSYLKFILFLAFIFIICLLIVIWFLGFGSRWDGKSKFAVVRESLNGDALVQILDPINSSVTNLTIPGSTEVQAARQLGTWKLSSITKLGKDKNEEKDFLKNTIIKSFNFPIDNSNDLSFIDQLRIKLFLLTLSNTSQINLNLEDTDYLTRAQLVDGSLGFEIKESIPTRVESLFDEDLGKNMTVTIINSTGSREEGNMVRKVVEVLGLNITSIQNTDKQNFDCVIKSNNNQLALKIAKIFDCNINLGMPANNFDIEINLGTNFVQRF